MARPKFAPQTNPCTWTDRQTPPPALSLDPSDLRRQTASGSDLPFFHNALAAGHTDGQTDRTFTGKFDDYQAAALRERRGLIMYRIISAREMTAQPNLLAEKMSHSRIIIVVIVSSSSSSSASVLSVHFNPFAADPVKALHFAILV